MHNEHRFALMIARLVDLVQRQEGGADDRRTALQGLVDAINKRSSTVRLDDGVLMVEGITAPKDVPFVKAFVERMTKHDVAEIHFPHRAAAIDVMEVALGLASEPKGEPLGVRLRRGGVTTVWVVGGEEATNIRNRRRLRVTDGLLGVSSVGDAAPPKDEMRDFVPAQEGAAYGQMVELATASAKTLTAAVKELRAVHDDPNRLAKGLNAVAVGVVKAVREDRLPEAIDAMISVIRQEAEEQREETKLRYGVALRRVLQQEVLQPLMKYLLDPLYDKDVGEIMKRAGPKGTQLLLDLLVSARTFAERRAFMGALRQMDSGLDMLVGMLDHNEWFVVRNVADLIGDMKIEESIPKLGNVAKHSDARVRLSAGLALLKIGTPSALKFVGPLLHDEDPKVRIETIRGVTGRGLAPLAMPLANAAGNEQEEDIQCELYRALGRIGSNDAVQALLKVVESKGLLSGFRADPLRLAATEGLGLAGGKPATQALEGLLKDRDKAVREMARRGLQGELTANGAD